MPFTIIVCLADSFFVQPMPNGDKALKRFDDLCRDPKVTIAVLYGPAGIVDSYTYRSEVRA